ncbi:MAG: phosphate signaling complex protein PhoU [Myxococcota bacterium]
MQVHTSQEFEAELAQLKDRLLAMGGRCEQMIDLAVRAFEEQDTELAREVGEMDGQVDRDELAVDELAVRILALRQPVGRDLRFIIAAVKAVTDLERIGDEAVNIAERGGELADRESLPKPHVEVPRMAEAATKMLHDALDAFVEEDDGKAQAVLRQDDDVDAAYERILQSCVEFIQAQPARAPGGLRVASAAKYLERIADHATNIAEMVVYLVQGVDVRHRSQR